MMTFKQFLKKLHEDKLFTKEDEGAVSSGGDVQSASPMANTDIVDKDNPDNNDSTGLTTTDILGKCDHQKDGFFGAGCFHIPLPAYVNKIQKRKKKKKDYDNM